MRSCELSVVSCCLWLKICNKVKVQRVILKMSEVAPKKKRRPSIPFSKEETDTLLQIIEENIVEVECNNMKDPNKPGSMKGFWKEKEDLWERIGRDMVSSGFPQRDTSSLRAKWTALKHKCRSESGAMMATYYKTGGGPYEEKEISDHASRVRDIMAQVNGLEGLRGQLNRPDDDEVMTETTTRSVPRPRDGNVPGITVVAIERPATVTSGALHQHRVPTDNEHPQPSLSSPDVAVENPEVSILFQPVSTSTQRVDFDETFFHPSSTQVPPTPPPISPTLEFEETLHDPRPERRRTPVASAPRASSSAGRREPTSGDDVRKRQVEYYGMLNQLAREDEERKKKVERRAEQKHEKEMEKIEEELKMARELHELKKAILMAELENAKKKNP